MTCSITMQRHPDGVGSVAFKEFESADLCVQKLNGRWFGGQKLVVSYWDGATNYQVEETDQEREQRLKKWEQFLKEGQSGKGKDGAESGEGDAKVPGKQNCVAFCMIELGRYTLPFPTPPEEHVCSCCCVVTEDEEHFSVVYTTVLKGKPS